MISILAMTSVRDDDDRGDRKRDEEGLQRAGKKIVQYVRSPKAEALELFKDDEYKLDLISDLEDGTISVYDQGDFTDLCRGPHVDNTKLCKNFKLVKYSGAVLEGRCEQPRDAAYLRCMFPDSRRSWRHI